MGVWWQTGGTGSWAATTGAVLAVSSSSAIKSPKSHIRSAWRQICIKKVARKTTATPTHRVQSVPVSAGFSVDIVCNVGCVDDDDDDLRANFAIICTSFRSSVAICVVKVRYVPSCWRLKSKNYLYCTLADLLSSVGWTRVFKIIFTTAFHDPCDKNLFVEIGFFDNTCQYLTEVCRSLSPSPSLHFPAATVESTWDPGVCIIIIIIFPYWWLS